MERQLSERAVTLIAATMQEARSYPNTPLPLKEGSGEGRIPRGFHPSPSLSPEGEGFSDSFYSSSTSMICTTPSPAAVT